MPSHFPVAEAGDNAVIVEIPPSPGALPNCAPARHMIVFDAMTGVYHVEGGSPHAREDIPGLLEDFRAKLAAIEWGAIAGMNVNRNDWM